MVLHSKATHCSYIYVSEKEHLEQKKLYDSRRSSSQLSTDLKGVAGHLSLEYVFEGG